MAFGDMLVQIRVPEKPAGSSMSDAAYTNAVTAAIDAHLTTIGISAAVPTWDSRSDLPNDDSGSVTFVSDRLGDAGIDVSKYDLTLLDKSGANPETIYCLTGSVLRCYGTVKLAPKPPSTVNLFEVTVSIDNGLSVTVPLHFVVRPLLTFPT